MQYGATFVRFWWLVLLTTTAGMGLGAVQNADSVAEYSATARVAVLPTRAKAENMNDRYLVALRAAQAGTVAKTRMDLYLALADDPELLAKLNESGSEVSPRDLADKVRVTAIGSTASMFVTVTDKDSFAAQDLAGRVAVAYADVITDVEKERKSETLLRGAVIGETTLAAPVTRPPTWRNPLIGGAAGLALGLGLAVLFAQLDPKVRDRRTREELLGVPVLGIIPTPTPTGRRVAPRSRGPEPIEELRTHIFFLRKTTARALRVTLAHVPPLTGTGDLAAALAKSLAETGSRVLVLDADVLASPEASSSQDTASVEAEESNADSFFSEEGGLADVLSGEQPEARPAVIPDPGLHGVVDILPAGQGEDISDDLLHGTAFENFLDRLSRKYDFVLVQTAPVAAGSGALAVAARTDVTVLVTARKGTRRRQLMASRSNLEHVGAHLAGSVIVS